MAKGVAKLRSVVATATPGHLLAPPLYGLNYFLYIVGKHISGLCECWNKETAGHVLLECRKYNVERKELFDKLAELGVIVFSVSSLFGHSDKHKLISEAVLQFLHNTGLYTRI